LAIKFLTIDTLTMDGIEIKVIIKEKRIAIPIRTYGGKKTS